MPVLANSVTLPTACLHQGVDARLRRDKHVHGLAIGRALGRLTSGREGDPQLVFTRTLEFGREFFQYGLHAVGAKYLEFSRICSACQQQQGNRCAFRYQRELNFHFTHFRKKFKRPKSASAGAAVRSDAPVFGEKTDGCQPF